VKGPSLETDPPEVVLIGPVGSFATASFTVRNTGTTALYVNWEKDWKLETERVN
jgi:hypothetical protein